VDLSRVVIGHCGDSTDLDYLRELMDNGSTIGMDRFGTSRLPTEHDRIATVATLCSQGYADRMVLSHDAAYFSINTEPSFRSLHEPKWVHTTVSDRILPMLRERGVAEELIDQMMTANPARLLDRSL
jgi:phosphotriesterase-related protein